MTLRRPGEEPPVRVDTHEECTRALDALWRHGGPPIEAPSVQALRIWGIDGEDDADAEAAR